MLDEVLKRVDELLWYQKLGDIADIDKVEYASLPPTHPLHPKEPGASNLLLVHAYTFIPKRAGAVMKLKKIFLCLELKLNLPIGDLREVNI